jgi:hypothetical protein
MRQATEGMKPQGERVLRLACDSRIPQKDLVHRAVGEVLTPTDGRLVPMT